MCACTDHWLGVLQCKQQCPDKLAVVAGEPISHFLPEIYHYLQFAYYKGKPCTCLSKEGSHHTAQAASSLGAPTYQVTHVESI